MLSTAKHVHHKTVAYQQIVHRNITAHTYRKDMYQVVSRTFTSGYDTHAARMSVIQHMGGLLQQYSHSDGPLEPGKSELGSQGWLRSAWGPSKGRLQMAALQKGSSGKADRTFIQHVAQQQVAQDGHVLLQGQVCWALVDDLEIALLESIDRQRLLAS